MNNYDVSIIVPVYNVENFIEKCATTLFEQDYDNIEYIFVNDCTPDNSIKVLKEVINRYPNRKDDIKIINNPINQGSSITRKNGLNNANGEYILFIDSDDWVELNMISCLYSLAIEKKVDLIIFDFFMSYKNIEIHVKQKYKPAIRNKNNILKMSLSGCFHGSLCVKMAKRSLYELIDFKLFSYLEDRYLSFQLLYLSNKIYHLNKPFLHYNQLNMNSITKKNDLNSVISDCKEYSNSIIELLKNEKLYEIFIEFHYIGILAIILDVSDGNITKNIKNICPNAYKIKYLWKNKNLSFLRKIIYTSLLLNITFIYKYSKIIYYKIKTKFIIKEN